MPRFRKKPVEIEARRVPIYDDDEGGITQYVDECIALAEWCGGVSHMMLADDEVSPAYGIDVTGPHIVIGTAEGPHAAMPGDFIIRGVRGEFYPCKPDIFEATYEPVAEPGDTPAARRWIVVVDVPHALRSYYYVLKAEDRGAAVLEAARRAIRDDGRACGWPNQPDDATEVPAEEREVAAASEAFVREVASFVLAAEYRKGS